MAVKRMIAAANAAAGSASGTLDGVQLRASNAVTDETVASFLLLQQAVRNWIEESLEVPLDKEDLLEALRNGVVLCYLMQEIDPPSIPKIQENTTQAFKLKENIEFFLAAANDLGVPRPKLFLFNDLFEAKNVVNVVDCLAELAKRAHEQHGFGVALQVSTDEQEGKQLLEKLSEDQRKKLKELLSRRRGVVRRVAPAAAATAAANATPQSPLTGSQIATGKMFALTTGQRIDKTKVEGKIIRFQAVFRGWRARKSYRVLARKAAFREKVVRELLSTEKSYVDNLNICISTFLTPLDEAAKSPKTTIISTEDVKSIFSVLVIIRNFNAKMLGELEARIGSSKWGPNGCVGDILFNNISDFLKVYTKYVQNFDSALKLVDQLRKDNSKLEHFLVDKSKDPVLKGLDLGAYLINPVQRIPRYNMLLKELVKYTWDDHPDAVNLKKAEQVVANVAEIINEKKREAEELAMILPISAAISGSPIYIPESHRRYLFQSPSSDQCYHFFLFSDIAMVTKGKGDNAPTTSSPAPTPVAEIKKKEKKRSSFLGFLGGSGSHSRSGSGSNLAVTPPSSPGNSSPRGSNAKFEYLDHYSVPSLEANAVAGSTTNEVEVSRPSGNSTPPSSNSPATRKALVSSLSAYGLLPLRLSLSTPEKQAEFLNLFRAAKNNDISGIMRSTALKVSTTKLAAGNANQNQQKKEVRLELLTSGKSTELLLQERRANKKPAAGGRLGRTLSTNLGRIRAELHR